MEENLGKTRLVHPSKAKGKKVFLIVGGGFGGLAAAKIAAKDDSIQTVLIDSHNYHLFQPLLYQVATAGLHAADIAVPIRAQFSENENVDVHMGHVEYVDLKNKFVRIKNYEVEYDYLLLACGARHSYFGRNEWEQFAPGLKSIEQAVEIRRRLLVAFERAENELDLDAQRALLTFVVVGGGPTGVELAGAIADLARTVLVDEFKRINTKQARIILVEGGNDVLGSFGPKLAERAQRDLRELGVDVRTGQRVTNITDKIVERIRGPFPRGRYSGRQA